MFRERVDVPIDPIPVEYINSICRINNEPDYSLSCLCVALLKSRIEDYKGISGTYSNNESKANSFTDFKSYVQTDNSYPLFCYYTYNVNDIEDETIMNELPEFKEKKNVSSFIKEKADCDCLVLYHETKNVVGIFIKSRDFRLYHLLISFLSLYFPAIFKDKPMTEEDYDVVKTLSNKERVNFYSAIKKLLHPYATEFKRFQLSTLMKEIHERKVNDALDSVNSQRYQLREIQNTYERAIDELKRYIVIYEGMKATESYDAPEEDLVEYLATNENVHNLKIQNDTLYFAVTTLLNNYNEQAWRTFKERGFIYDGEYGTGLPDVFRNKEHRKIMLDNIFSDDPLLRIKMAGNYRINLHRCSVNTDKHFDYEVADPMFKSYIPNPHLKLFECLGGYSYRVNELLQDRNYIAAIETCIASAGSVNLDETQQTFRPFLGWLLSSKEKVLVNNEGEEMTPEEALVWLVDKEKKDETN